MIISVMFLVHGIPNIVSRTLIFVEKGIVTVWDSTVKLAG